ncbi:Carboxy-S-adenosyl-L-methionine synthase [Sporomusa carbonis]|uniref:class I SAM-dependent methyltransferase n=1 Tax=Sporomusa carbonis TaxID=3076075 RepID=UPI003A67A28A
MRDNKTSQPAAEYDANVHKTIPRYHLFHDETLDLVKVAVPRPQSWLDTGCGTGTLIVKAIEQFEHLRFVAADPSEGMLDIAAGKLANNDITYVLSGSEDLHYPDSFDVVTAIMVHHYLNEEGRRKATQNCFHMLKPGGIYITFETIKPNTENGTQIGLKRWRNAQLLSGKSPEAADKHISRYGSELLPITIAAHMELLTETGFSTVEIFWVSGMQAGFYGIK